MSSSSWQVPLAKLVGLLVILPFVATGLHLHYRSFVRNEYCFVGPAPAVGLGVDLDVHADGVDDGIRVDGTATAAANDYGFRGIGEGYPYHGIYTPSTTTFGGTKKGGKRDDGGLYRQIYSPSDDDSWSSPWPWTGEVWPSITRASAVVSLLPSSSSSSYSSRVISFVDADGGGRWCVGSPGEEIRSWCADPADGTLSAQFPPSGMWKSNRANESTGAPSILRVTCPTASFSVPTDGGGERHKMQNARQNENLRFVLDRPGTTFLLLLNVGLAFQYWNNRIDPSSVSKQYHRIVVEGEWWRGLTGATAHFEPLHLGFNAMSLRNLGNELEGTNGRWYGDTVAFLIYNVALVVFTTATMMTLVHARLWLAQRRLPPPASPLRASSEERMRRLRDTSSVGYSAVLFAWMVVSTMERTAPTCPVPFFSDVCFATHAVPGMPFLKFNVGPIVSLFVAQFIMPRVSFMGHLAGIICGFCLHWGIFPPLEVCSPNVLIGGAFLVGLIWRSRVIPVRPLLTSDMDEEGCVEHEEYLISLLKAENGDEGVNHHRSCNNNASGLAPDPIALGKQRKRERELNESLRKQRTLLTIRYLLGMVTFASLLVFGWNSSLFLSQCLLLVYFIFGAQSSSIVWAYMRSEVENDIIVPEKHRSGMIWRGFMMSAVISIVIDSMSFASWLSVPIISTKMPLVGLPIVSLFMTFRLAVCLLALVVASKILHELGEVGGGIFVHVFSLVIDWSKSVGDNGAFALQRQPLWTAFEGRGITLGRRQADVL